jgi:hypothetical protein
MESIPNSFAADLGAPHEAKYMPGRAARAWKTAHPGSNPRGALASGHLNKRARQPLRAGRERARPENRKSITGQEGDAGFFSLPRL